jgi:hypothetical protein
VTVPNEKRTYFALHFSIIGDMLTNDGVSLGKEREKDTHAGERTRPGEQECSDNGGVF